MKTETEKRQEKESITEKEPETEKESTLLKQIAQPLLSWYDRGRRILPFPFLPLL